MHISELQNLAIAAVTGLFAGGLLILLFQELPTLPLSGSYINLQILLFFGFVGLLITSFVHAETPRGRLIVMFLILWSSTSVVGGVATQSNIAILVQFGGVALITAVPGVYWGRSNPSARRILFHLTGLLATVLFSFSVIYVAASVSATNNLVLVVPFLVLAIGYLASLDGIRNELAAL